MDSLGYSDLFSYIIINKTVTYFKIQSNSQSTHYMCKIKKEVYIYVYVYGYLYF